MDTRRSDIQFGRRWERLDIVDRITLELALGKSPNEILPDLIAWMRERTDKETEERKAVSA